MKVLIFSPSFYPLTNAEELVSNKFAQVLASRKNAVTVICRAPVTIRECDCSAIDGFESITRIVVPWRASSRVVDHFWRGVSMLSGYPAIHGAGWAIAAARCASKLHASDPFDVVVSRSLPEAAHLAGLLFTSDNRIPWIANWNDPPMIVLPPPYGGGAEKPIRGDFVRLIRQVARRAGCHSFPSRRLRLYMEPLFGNRNLRAVEIVRHVGEVLPPGKVLPDRFALRHSGELKKPRDVVPLLKGLREFIQRSGAGSSVSLEMAGVVDDDFYEWVKRLGLDRYVTFHGRLGYAESLSFAGHASVNVLVEAPMREGVFLPSKLIDYARVGRPTLALSPVPGEVNDLLGQYGGGVVCNPDDPSAIAAAIERLFDLWKSGTLDRELSTDRLAAAFSTASVYEAFLRAVERARQHGNVRCGTTATP